ncbi:MAG TPA: single-stranded DNA-binding protein, partial [Firmicutes bacterium]|nr:single-stranded DNA-binding protein [Bacillota bacterium]
KRYVTEIMADDVEFLAKSGEKKDERPELDVLVDDSELPF